MIDDLIARHSPFSSNRPLSRVEDLRLAIANKQWEIRHLEQELKKALEFTPERIAERALEAFKEGVTSDD